MLWHAKLDSLKGFYQSDVLVSSANKQSAIYQAEEAVRAWHDQHIEDHYFSPVVSADPDEEEFDQEVSEWMAAVRAELEDKMQEIESGALVMRSI